MKETIVKQFVSILIMALYFFSGNTNADALTLLRMNHQFPADATGSRIDQWFAEEIKKATKGEVEIKIFWSNGLGEPQENLILLQNGYIDMAAMSAGYFPAELPLFSAPNSIPMGMDNICQASVIMKAFWTRIPAYQEEAARVEIRPLFFHLLNPYLLVTKQPVTRFSDLKGMRIRTWGKDIPRLFEAAGAKPITLFLPDIYEALRHDVIDGCPFSVDLTVSYKVYELARHITEVVIWEGPGWGVWINEKSWRNLSGDQQRIFLEVAERARQMEIPATLAAGNQARDFLQSQGVRFHPFPPEELEKWQSAGPDFFTELLDKLEKDGHGEAGRNTIRIWKEIRQNVQCP